MPEQAGEVVERGARHPGDRVAHGVVVQAGGVGDDRALPVVLPVDAQHLEPPREVLDLAKEVVGGEPPLAEGLGQRVGRGGQRDAAVGELAQQPGHQDGVARVVELELVDAHQPAARERVDGRPEAEGTDEVRVLDERAVGGGLGPDRVRQGREQVRLADAEAAVQVHGGHGAGAAPEPARPATATAAGQLGGDGAQPVHGGLLARVARVGPVGVEGLPGEVPRRDALGQQPVGCHLGAALGQPRGGGGGGAHGGTA